MTSHKVTVSQGHKKANSITISYTALLNTVSTEVGMGLRQAERILEYVRLQTYWKVGRHIERYAAGASRSNRATHAFYERLSADLLKKKKIDMSIDVLKRCAQFFRHYPSFPKDTPLTWTHYLCLMRVDDDKLRLRMERDAVKRGWDSADLKRQLRSIKDAGEPVAVSGGQLVYERGIPYTYQITRTRDMRGQTILALDCGFNLCRDIPEGVSQKFASGQTVCSHKTADGYTLTTNNKRRGKNYTYAAAVLRVVDGDTLDLFIDPGFEIKMKDERVRLRGINAPEMSTAAGPGAKEFLVRLLAACPVVVVRTIKASGVADSEAKGMFGRWLVDLYVLPGCDDPVAIAKEGTYVNQMMIDKGFAVIY